MNNKKVINVCTDALVAQLEEAIALRAIQCEFESHQAHFI